MDGHAISFGPFRLLAAQRLLLEGGEPVLLRSRAFDILAALVELPGEVVGKEDSNYYSRPKAFGSRFVWSDVVGTKLDAKAAVQTS